MFNGLAAGTYFNSGAFSLITDSTEVGWVTFEVPDGVKVAQVHWNAGDGSPVTWVITPGHSRAAGPAAVGRLGLSEVIPAMNAAYHAGVAGRLYGLLIGLEGRIRDHVYTLVPGGTGSCARSSLMSGSWSNALACKGTVSARLPPSAARENNVECPRRARGGGDMSC